MQSSRHQHYDISTDRSNLCNKETLTVTQLAGGSGLRVETDLPHLVSLGGGRLSTGVTLLPLLPGKSTVGSLESSRDADIVIRGIGVDPVHCYLVNERESVILHPLSSLTAVDGVRISSPTRLQQGSMLCFGYSNYFRFNNPTEANKIKAELPTVMQNAAQMSNFSNGYADEIQDSDDATGNPCSQHVGLGLYDNVKDVQLSSRSKQILDREEQLTSLGNPDFYPDTSLIELDSSDPASAEHLYAGQRVDLIAAAIAQRIQKNAQSFSRRTDDRCTDQNTRKYPTSKDSTSADETVEDNNNASCIYASMPVAACGARNAFQHPLNASGLPGTSAEDYSDYWSGYDNISAMKNFVSVAEIDSDSQRRLASHSKTVKNFESDQLQALESHKIMASAEHGMDADASKKGVGLDEDSSSSHDHSQMDSGRLNEQTACITNMLVLNNTPSSSIIDRDTDSCDTQNSSKPLTGRLDSKQRSNLVAIAQIKRSSVCEKVTSRLAIGPTQSDPCCDLQVKQQPIPNSRCMKQKSDVSVTFLSSMCLSIKPKTSHAAKPCEEAVRNTQSTWKPKSPSLTTEKPPISKHHRDKVLDSKKNKKEEEGLSKPGSKISMLKSLLTRSRSPSPSNVVKRPESPAMTRASLIAKRLSEPLIISFRQPCADKNFKICLHVSENIVRKSSSNHEECNLTESNKIEGLNLADESSSASLSDDRCETEHDSEQAKFMNLEFLDCHSQTETLATQCPKTVTTTDCHNQNHDTSADVKTQMQEKFVLKNPSMQSAEPVTIAMHTNLQMQDVENPWRVNLRGRSFNPNLENFKGEKLFSRDTPTTNVILPALELFSLHAREPKPITDDQLKQQINHENSSGYIESPPKILTQFQLMSDDPSRLKQHKMSNKIRCPVDEKWEAITLDVDVVDELVEDKNIPLAHAAQLQSPNTANAGDASRVDDLSESESVLSESHKDLRNLYESTKAQRILEEESAKTEMERGEKIRRLWEQYDTGNNITRKHDTMAEEKSEDVTYWDISRPFHEKKVPMNGDQDNEFVKFEIDDQTKEESKILKHEHQNQTDAGDPTIALLTKRHRVMCSISQLKERISQVDVQQKNLIRLLTQEQMGLLQTKPSKQEAVWNSVHPQRGLQFASNRHQLVKQRSQLEAECRKSNGELSEIEESLQNLLMTSQKKPSPQLVTGKTLQRQWYNSMDTRRISSRNINDGSNESVMNHVDSRRPARNGTLTRSNSANATRLSVTLKPSHQALLTASHAQKLQPTKPQAVDRSTSMLDSFIDLRTFVESCGHKLAQCASVEVSLSQCRGPLLKLNSDGATIRKWMKRWFVFDRAKRCLYYYADSKCEQKQQKSIYFQSIEDVFVDHLVKNSGAGLTFCVRTLDRTYYLMAQSVEAMRIWIDVIITGAEAHQHFMQ